MATPDFIKTAIQQICHCTWINPIPPIFCKKTLVRAKQSRAMHQFGVKWAVPQLTREEAVYLEQQQEFLKQRSDREN